MGDTAAVNTTHLNSVSEASMNPFQTLFDAQKSYFASGATRSYGWRIEQPDRMGQLLVQNEAAPQASGQAVVDAF